MLEFLRLQNYGAVAVGGLNEETHQKVRWRARVSAGPGAAARFAPFSSRLIPGTSQGLRLGAAPVREGMLRVSRLFPEFWRTKLQPNCSWHGRTRDCCRHLLLPAAPERASRACILPPHSPHPLLQVLGSSHFLTALLSLSSRNSAMRKLRTRAE